MQGRFPAPQRLTLCKDVLPELWREVGGRQAQVSGGQLQHLCLEHVPDLGSLLQSWVLQHLQQEGSAIFDLQETAEGESHYLRSREPLWLRWASVSSKRIDCQTELLRSPPASQHHRQNKRAFRETHAVAGAVQLAAEHEAGLLQQQVGVAVPVSSLQAGLCLFQEELEAKGSV